MIGTDQETLATPEWTIKNRQSRDTCNIEFNTHNDDKHNKDTKHNK
jgi:hypothetical protein